jgi:quercetin dioxygenase-like cupin family protein
MHNRNSNSKATTVDRPEEAQLACDAEVIGAGAAKGTRRKLNMNLTLNQEVLHHRENYLVRRQRLAPGEATPWHRDPFHRVTVVLSGDLLNIEFRDGGETQSWKITVGEVDWSEPSDRVHRAVNVGKEVFEEVVTFFLDHPEAVPQPEADSN